MLSVTLAGEVHAKLSPQKTFGRYFTTRDCDKIKFPVD